ncbi:uncharacterized protein N7483_011376 [Penicillium malachiteum]|uniref:uncharacterized protein n=1 Tax=Penicillium malachiteum TaxID=1324776 RepID=UPI00254659B3|nr:uncharacterized protein N7483_011376 [Penicillium malachiteum]KAJ5714195.1 hypothetical protein N7483_011376 [Penicillium malachiteum]
MRWSLVLALLAGVAVADDTTTTDSTTDSTTTASTTESSTSSLALSDATTVTDPSSVVPTGSYEIYSTTITLADGHDLTSTITQNASATTGNSTSSYTTTHNSVTVLVGGGGTTTLGSNTTMNATATSTSTSAIATNTRPCNGYAEYCERSYSNITMVAAHNSPFVRKGNAAANQEFTVKYQLDDGIRMLQFQAHNQNGTMELCHTSCSLLDVGTLEDYLTTVTKWIRENPYDVVTILMGNYDYVSPSHFVPAIQSSGLYDYVYTPSKIPMGLDDWPTLSEMIISGKRAVLFMDYQANQTAYPWLMDEFSQMWETPFSPTNRSFPCTEQRPGDITVAQAKKRMYMANHNLNIELSFGSIDLLIPNTAVISETNAYNATGSLGTMARECTEKWDRPPNFLLVDYYNDGNFNGSVFEVAAEMNNVTFNNQSCCGTASAAVHGVSMSSVSTLMLVAAGVQFFLSAF